MRGGGRGGEKARTRETEEERDRLIKGEGKRAGRTGSREGEDEEGGGALAEVLEGRRSQCTAGECNARQAIRGPTSESAFYRTLRHRSFPSLSFSCSRHYYTRTRVSVVSARHQIRLDARSYCTRCVQ